MAYLQAIPQITWLCWNCATILDVDKTAKAWSCGKCGKWSAVPELAVRSIEE